MGLDTVELVIRTEEVFGITLPDDECEQIRTVGDLYRLVLTKLDLPYIHSEQIHGEGKATSRLRLPIRKLLHKTIEFPVTPDPVIHPWTTQEVWLTLKAIIQDQLQIDHPKSGNQPPSKTTSAATETPDAHQNGVPHSCAKRMGGISREARTSFGRAGFQPCR